MKRQIGIVVDSTVGTHFKRKIFSDASVVPLSISFEGRTFLDGDQSDADVLTMLQSKQKMRIEAPTPERFIKAYREQLSLGYTDVICLVSDKNLSDTYRVATLTQEILGNEHIVVVDSKTISHGMGYLLEVLYKNIEQERSLTEVLEVLNEAINRIEIFFIQYKYEPKRTSFNSQQPMKDMFYRLFGKKTIYRYQYGSIDYLNCMRSEDKLITYLLGFIAKKQDDLHMINLTYTGNLHDAKLIGHELYQQFKTCPVTYYGRMHPLIATHLGTSGISILCI